MLRTLDGVVDEAGAEPVTDRPVMVVADPALSSGDPAPWPGPVAWSDMEPMEGEDRCVVLERDDARSALDAVDDPAETQVFETDDGDLVVTAGARALLPSEDGCPG